MAVSDNDRQILDALVDAREVSFTAEDREAIVRAGVPVGCVVRCLIDFARCGGPTNPQCVIQFVGCMASCLRGGG
jgi:hypothetical protein